MKYIDLFAGIGGFRLGIEQANKGFECVYSNEWDKYANELYTKHFGQCDSRDIRDVPSSDIPDFDLLVGGFPCQAFSVAGKRKGFDDTRGTLFFEIARILADKRPRYFVLENVKGLLNHDSGKTFSTILKVLSDLGYEYQWMVLNSKDFGVPQNRERVFIVGNIRGESRTKVFPFSNIGGEASFGTVKSTYHKGQTSGSYVATSLLDVSYPSRIREYKEIAPTVRDYGSGGNKMPFVALTEKRTEEAKELRRMVKHKDFSPRRMKYLTARADGRIGALTSSRNFENLLANGMVIRKLTPIECERLQGFPDNWTQGISDTQRYKCLGNAVTVNVIESIARKLL